MYIYCRLQYLLQLAMVCTKFLSIHSTLNSVQRSTICSTYMALFFLNFGEVREVSHSDGGGGEPREAAPPCREPQDSPQHSGREHLKLDKDNHKESAIEVRFYIFFLTNSMHLIDIYCIFFI